MFDSTYRLLSMFAAVGRIRGRKKLQKMVYLLTAAGIPFHYKFKYHHFGPYSAELQSEISDLVDKELLAETNEEQAYVYEVAPQGKLFLRRLEEQANFDQTFEDHSTLLNQLAEQNSQFLEIVSTYVFLLRSGDPPAEAQKKAAELKSHLQPSLEEAVQYVQKHMIC